MNILRKLTVVIVALGSVSVSDALAIPVEIGLATDVTVLPGSTYQVSFEIRNTGTSAMEFAVPQEFGLWTFDGGSFGGSEGDWNISSARTTNPDLFTQFNGVTIGAGESQLFNYATMSIPDLAVGSVAQAEATFRLSLPFSADPLDMFYGGTLVGGTNLPNYSNRHELTFTIGDAFSSSSPTFIEACIVDRRDGSILSGPPEYGCTYASLVPEPSTFALLGLGLVGMAARRRKKV